MRLNLSLHCHHQNDWGVGGGRVRGRLNLTSHCHHQNDCSVKTGKREENRSGIKPRTFCVPAVQRLTARPIRLPDHGGVNM